MGTQLPRMRFNPPPNWPPAPAGWTPPAGWEPDVAWGPLPPGWPLWVEAKQRSWFARHKVLSSIGASVLGMFLLLCVIASVAGTTTQAGQDWSSPLGPDTLKPGSGLGEGCSGAPSIEVPRGVPQGRG